jgi:hypothetical protein
VICDKKKSQFYNLYQSPYSLTVIFFEFIPGNLLRTSI